MIVGLVLVLANSVVKGLSSGGGEWGLMMRSIFVVGKAHCLNLES